MHEEALLRDLRRKIEEIARTERAVRFSRVQLWIGALSHVTEPTLRGRWEVTVRGTAAEGARLEVETSHELDNPRADRVVLVGVDVPADGREADAHDAVAGDFARTSGHSVGASGEP